MLYPYLIVIRTLSYQDLQLMLSTVHVCSDVKEMVRIPQMHSRSHYEHLILSRDLHCWELLLFLLWIVILYISLCTRCELHCTGCSLIMKSNLVLVNNAKLSFMHKTIFLNCPWLKCIEELFQLSFVYGKFFSPSHFIKLKLRFFSLFCYIFFNPHE